jgi:hypothetical protein
VVSWKFYPASEFFIYMPVWDALNEEGGNSPLLGSEFVLASLRCFGAGNEKLAILGDPLRPDAMAILVTGNGLSWNSFQPSQAPIGFWLMRPALILEGVLTSLLHALPGLVMGVTQQDPLLMLRPVDTGRLLSFDYIDTMHIDLNMDYQSYWQARGKNLRQNMRTVCNRLEKNGLSYQLHCIRTADQVAFSMEHFARMESSGWKGIEGTAVQFDGVQGRFYVDLLQKFCEQGMGFIYYLTFNEAIVAMDLCICRNGLLIVLKTTYDEASHEYSPAMLLHQQLVKCLLPLADFKRLEFYGKARDWQLRLTDQSRTLYHVNVYRWAWLRRIMQERIRWSRKINSNTLKRRVESSKRAVSRGDAENAV